MQVGTANVTQAGDNLKTDLKLSYTKPAGKAVVTADFLPALKQVRSTYGHA